MTTMTTAAMFRLGAEINAAKVATRKLNASAPMFAYEHELNDWHGVPAAPARRGAIKFQETAVVTMVGAGRGSSKRTKVRLGMTVAQLSGLGYKDHDLRWDTQHGVLAIA